MVDARLPEKWLSDRRLLRLDADYFRSFAYALMWSVSNRTDGRIEPEDLELIPRFAEGAEKAFVAAGLWTALPKGWRITDFTATQTSRSDLEVLENIRAAEARKKRRQRASKAAERASVPGTVPGDAPGGRSPGTAQEGQARTGKEGKERDHPTEFGVNGHAEMGLSPTDLDLCWDCRENLPVGSSARGNDDALLCRGCNDDRLADELAAYDQESL